MSCKRVHWSAEAKSEMQEEGAKCRLEGLLEMGLLEVVAEGVRPGTHSEGWKERVSDKLNRSCDAKTFYVTLHYRKLC